jgi:hypothetical protein
MLPKGLIRAKSEGGTEMGLNYLDAFIWPEGQQLGIQYEHAAELAEFASRMGEPIRATELAERLTGVQPTMDTVYMTGGTDHVVPDYQPDILTTQMPWNDVSLRERLKGTGHRLSGSLQDGTVNPALIELGRHLLYQVLLHIGQEPLYIEHAPTAWVRKPKMEGRHLKPGLVQAMYVGDLRPELWKEPVHREKGEPTGETHAAHWVRGHRRRQHFKGGVTKLIWIKPYKTGKQDID